MSFSSGPLGSEDDKKEHELPAMPWDQRPSILEFVSSHIAEDKPGMTEDGYRLPDDERVFKRSKIRWVAGAMDGVTAHHMAKGESDENVRRVIELVLAYTRQPTAINKAAVYNHIIDQHIVSMLDPVIEALLNDDHID